MHYRLIIFLSVCFFSATLNAQVVEYDRHITKTYRVSNTVTVEISNKYGRIHIIPWDNDSVRFTIDMRIRAKDKLKVDKIKQNVEFEFTPSQYFLIAHTKFGEGGSDVIKDIMDIAGSYFSASNSVTINYTVMVPSQASLKIDNKFGDVYLEDHNGPVNLTLSYGDLKANRLNGRTDLKITSGDAEVDYIKEGYIFISYSNFHVRESNRLTAQTQSSVVTIEKINSIKLNSRRDKLFINEIGYLSGESYFSNIDIDRLRNDVALNSRFGDISIDDIQRSCESINISSELTDINLSFARPMSFGFELIHHQSVTFGYPAAYAKISTKVINANDNIYSTSGTFGSGSPDSRVTIKAPRKCNITISQL
jgi:hypothetical protein